MYVIFRPSDISRSGLLVRITTARDGAFHVLDFARSNPRTYTANPALIFFARKVEFVGPPRRYCALPVAGFYRLENLRRYTVCLYVWGTDLVCWEANRSRRYGNRISVTFKTWLGNCLCWNLFNKTNCFHIGRLYTGFARKFSLFIDDFHFINFTSVI